MNLLRGRFYRITRDLHLYLGLFSSPFVLVFSVTVFFIVHAWLPKSAADAPKTRVVTGFILPENIETLSGRPLVDALRIALANANVPGEVGFVQHNATERTFVIPVTVPGRETVATVKVATSEATIVTREPGLAAAMLTLHKSPGQHGSNIRMNWFYMRAWRWLADATVYLILFISVSGIYLWYILRAERRVGIWLLVAGGVTFFGMVYALAH